VELAADIAGRVLKPDDSALIKVVQGHGFPAARRYVATAVR
jgi:hypothetical protein